MKLVGLGGSLRQRSYSRAALKEVLRIAVELGAETEMLEVRELNLPMFAPNLAVSEYPASQRPAVARVLAACRSADAMLWATPTYHGTMSGVVKNALDFLELLADDEPPYLSRRAVGLIAVSDPRTFGALMNSAQDLRAWLAPTSLAFDHEDFDGDLRLLTGRPERRARRLVSELMEYVT
ncbi:MAG: NADPH-dependent FMN reductase [Anaerolineales bacterium]